MDVTLVVSTGYQLGVSRWDSGFEVTGGQWIKGCDHSSAITAKANTVSQGNVSKSKAREKDKACWIPQSLWAKQHIGMFIQQRKYRCKDGPHVANILLVRQNVSLGKKKHVSHKGAICGVPTYNNLSGLDVWKRVYGCIYRICAHAILCGSAPWSAFSVHIHSTDRC